MTYRDIIRSINYKIENSNFERFDIAQVIDELNNTYRDLANKTDLFETVEYIAVAENVPTYALPERLRRATRAVWRGQRIDFVSQEAMDANLPGWALDTSESTLQYLVYNNMADRQFAVYPVLTNTAYEYSTATMQYYGELSAISNDTYRYMYRHPTTGALFLSDIKAAYGTISDLGLFEVLTIYGAYLPPLVTEAVLDSTEIYIDESRVNALIYGTAGNLLFTSGRTEDAQKAKSFMQLYGVDETEVQAIRNSMFTNDFRNVKRSSYYRTPFK